MGWILCLWIIERDVGVCLTWLCLCASACLQSQPPLNFKQIQCHNLLLPLKSYCFYPRGPVFCWDNPSTTLAFNVHTTLALALLLVVSLNKASYVPPLMHLAGGCHVFLNPSCIQIRTPQISDVPKIISVFKSSFLRLIYILSRLMWCSEPGQLNILEWEPDVSSDLGFERIRPHYGKWSKLILPCSLCSPVIFSSGSKKSSLIPP